MPDRIDTNEQGSVRIDRSLNLTENSSLRTAQGLQGFVRPRQDGSTGEREGQQIAIRQDNRRGRAKSGRPTLSDASTYQERYAIMRHLEQAKREVEQLVALAEASDAIEMATGVRRLQEPLRQLWRLRKAREEEWGEVVNVVQGVLNRVVSEQITPAHANALHVAIRDHLALGTIAAHQPKQVRALLRDAGLDPWAPLHLQDGKDANDSGK